MEGRLEVRRDVCLAKSTFWEYKNNYARIEEYVPKEEVLGRIEVHFDELAKTIEKSSSSDRSQFYELRLVSRTNQDTFDKSINQTRFKKDKVKRKTFKRSSKTYMQMWRTLDFIHQIVSENKIVTQRESK